MHRFRSAAVSGAGAPTATEMTQIFGRPTNRSITLSLLAPDAIEAFVEYGTPARRIYREDSRRDDFAGEAPRDPD